jgi:hypothetical protein
MILSTRNLLRLFMFVGHFPSGHGAGAKNYPIRSGRGRRRGSTLFVPMWLRQNIFVSAYMSWMSHKLEGNLPWPLPSRRVVKGRRGGAAP